MTRRSERFWKLFEGSDIGHGRTKVTGAKGRDGKIEGKSYAVRKPLTEEMVEKHLAGIQGYAAVPINSSSQAHWSCIDIDIYGLDLLEVVRRGKKLKIPIIVCRSKSGGAHVYIFFKDWVSADLLHDILIEITAALGYSYSTRGSKTELFPKQREILLARDDMGNYINLPYFNADQTTRYALDTDGNGLDLEQFMQLAEDSRCDLSDLEHILLQNQTDESELQDYPPCIRRIVGLGGFSQNRNESLFHVGVALRKERPDDFEQAVVEFNSRYMVPPLDLSEVMSVQKQHLKKDYGFKCDTGPMKDHCDKELCRKAKFGIGGGAPSFPRLSGLTLMQSDPRLYLLNVDGRRIELSPAQLNSPREFQLKCLSDLNLRPPILKESEWGILLGDLLDKCVEFEVAPELTTEGQFLEHLEDYCTSRIRALVPEELKTGKPWTNNGKTYFTMAGLMEFLKRREFTSLTRIQIQEKIKRLHGGGEGYTDVLAVKKVDGTRTTTRAWVVPAYDTTELDTTTEEHDGKVPF